MEACLGLDRPHPPIIDEIGIFKNEAGAWSGYIHGTAEHEAGFDIPEFISGILPDYTGEIPCVLVLPGKEIQCTMIQWKPAESEREHWKYRALICANDDRKGLDYAIRCFNERKSNL